MSAAHEASQNAVPTHAIELARNVLEIEAGAVQALAARLDAQFARAVELLLQCTHLFGLRRRQQPGRRPGRARPSRQQ